MGEHNRVPYILRINNDEKGIYDCKSSVCLGFYASVALREGLEENSALCKQFKRVCSKPNTVNYGS